ncbi:putative glutathione-specific gamma-glutamylcyclotransferase 2 [Pollicipes pollicipes]|uniref:putative glutathione-specific gamma-glutamylcyclotransferase 2 n=1 Tax=Pollicipes pollicipes TaxID=41117 RepID=UPI0018849DD3|nr:putative glutathione-specific gamma-glutamylcyclotransferase 2 [Pollicipes pollicipes]
MGLSGLSAEFVDCLSSHELSPEPARVWVFGYGSLCWRPGFPYSERRIGHVEGYMRRFWQGSVTHRGTRDKPGRVATLVERTQGVTWGCAFCITDPAAINYLHSREVSLGGYETRVTRFQPRDGRQRAFPVMLYLATDDNPQWLGPAPLAQLAEQVAGARGWKGPNADYVLQLVRFMKRRDGSIAAEPAAEPPGRRC